MLEALENPVKREFSRAFLRSIFDFYDVIENKRLETEEKQYYDCCGAVTVGQEPHEWEDGKCAECGYGCTHSGGTATCTARAVCELCGQPYGEKAPDNHTGQEACSGGTAACTAKAVCQVCGRSYGDLDPDNHINLTEIEAVAATQQAEGNTAYWYCEDCGRYFADADASEEISQEDTVIDKLPADTSENGSDGRPENGDDTTAGGTGTAGSSGSQQSGSGTSTSGGTSAKDSPKTGDDTAVGFWMGAMTVSALLAACCLVLYRKKKA